jgi:hypothetical protein
VRKEANKFNALAESGLRHHVLRCIASCFHNSLAVWPEHDNKLSWR